MMVPGSEGSRKRDGGGMATEGTDTRWAEAAEGAGGQGCVERH